MKELETKDRFASKKRNLSKQVQTITILIIILTILSFPNVQAIELQPGENVTIGETYIHCNKAIYNITFLCDNLANLTESFYSIQKNITHCMILSENYTDCRDELKDKQTSTHDLQGTIDYLNADITEYKAEIESLKASDTTEVAALKTEIEQHKASINICVAENKEYKDNQYLYPILAAIATFGITWYTFHKRVSGSKGLETHEGRGLG